MEATLVTESSIRIESRIVSRWFVHFLAIDGRVSPSLNGSTRGEEKGGEEDKKRGYRDGMRRIDDNASRYRSYLLSLSHAARLCVSRVIRARALDVKSAKPSDHPLMELPDPL